VIPDLANSQTLQSINAGQKQGKGSGFNIPDLSQLFPDENLSPTSELPNFSPTPGKLLTGSPITGDKSGKLKPLNVNALEQLGIQADQLGYNLSDQDYLKRFPQLAQARDYNINSAGLNLSGQQDPFINDALQRAGLGDINLGTGEHTIERNMGVKIGSKETRDRTYFQRLLADNPVRAFGLNTQDIEKIALANTNGINMNALGLAQTAADRAVANASASGADQQALLSAIGSIGSAGVKAASNYFSPTLQSSYYAPPPPPGYNTGVGFSDPYSGNFYNPNGDYIGNTITGEGT
jgi:hypothetical protein